MEEGGGGGKGGSEAASLPKMTSDNDHKGGSSSGGSTRLGGGNGGRCSASANSDKKHKKRKKNWNHHRHFSTSSENSSTSNDGMKDFKKVTYGTFQKNSEDDKFLQWVRSNEEKAQADFKFVFRDYIQSYPDNYFRFFLTLCQNIMKRNRLLEKVMYFFGTHLRSRENPNDDKFLTKEIQMDSFLTFIPSKSENYVKEASKIFDWKSISQELNDDLNFLISPGRLYGKVYVILRVWNMEETYFTDVVNRLIIPSILDVNAPRGGLLNVLNYSKNFSVAIKKEIVHFLDSFTLFKDHDKMCLFKSYNLPLNSLRIWKRQFLFKSISKALEYWEDEVDPIDDVPNFRKSRVYDQLMYDLRQRKKNSIAKNMSLASWRELIASYLDVYPGYLYNVWNVLSRSGDYGEMRYWVEKLSITQKSLKCDQETWNKIMSSQPTLESEIDRSKFYPLNNHNITIVNNSENFDKFVATFSKTSETVITGFDAEFEINPYVLTKSLVSIIQIALKEQIFILDLMDLKQNPEKMKSVRNLYFDNPHVIILGFGIKSDYDNLMNTSGVFNCFTEKKKLKSTTLDLLEITQERLAKSFRYPFEKKEKGLAGLTEQLFGLPLYKGEQRSNWNNRPFRPNQITYAAHDAFVLIEIYEKFHSMIQDQQLLKKMFS